MAVRFYVSTKKNAARLSVYCEIQASGKHKRFKTRFAVPLDRWDDRAQQCRIRRGQTPLDEQTLHNQLSATNKSLLNLRAEIESLLAVGYDESALRALIEGEQHEPQKELTLPDDLREYAMNARLSTNRKRHYEVLARLLRRFSEYEGRDMKPTETTMQDLEDIARFIESEHLLQHTAQYKKRITTPQAQPIEQRGNNTIHSMMAILKAYYKHLYKTGRIERNPFDRYDMPSEVYGTPTILSWDEVCHIFAYPIQSASRAIQRDIFIFQCCVGCRVSDLMRFSWDNVERDSEGDLCLSYIPKKTSAKSAQAVRVPLCAMAVEIIERYKDSRGWRLLPCVSTQKYNDNIKAILQECEITRRVTIRNPKTGEGEQVRLCDVASSHIARRTTASDLHRRGYSETLISEITGHGYGSKSLKRYIKTDDQQKKRAMLNR